MPKYKITYEDVSIYSIEIEAESYEVALDIAHELENPREHDTATDEGSHLDFVVDEPPIQTN